MTRQASGAIGGEGPLSRFAPGSIADILVLVVVWVAMVLIVDPTGDFPINDDWVYAAAVRSLIDHGRFEIYSFSSANVGPQVYWGALFAKLFGFSFTSLRCSTLVLGLAGGVGVYIVFREVWKDRTGALVLALAVLVNPVYFVLSNSFMTDVPFVALIVASMASIAAGIGRDRVALVAIGLGLALVTMLLRQFAVIVLVGFAVAFVARRGIAPKTLVVAVLPLVAGILLNWLFTKWLVDTGRKPYPAGISTISFSIDGRLFWYAKAALFSALSYVGLFLVPLVVIYLPTVGDRVGRRGRIALLGAVGLLTLLIGYAYIARGLTVPIGENVLSWFGVGPLTNGDTLMHEQNLPRESPLAAGSWKVVTALAILASATLLVACAPGARRLRTLLAEWHDESNRRRLALGGFFVGCGASYLGILALLSSNSTVFDRYMLPLMIVAAFALPLLQPASSRPATSRRLRLSVAAVLLTASAVFSVVSTHDFLQWSGVRWAALHQLVADGVPIDRIDGGYEFTGWYLYDPLYKVAEGKNWWWVHEDEFQAASGPIPGYRVYRRYPVDRWWHNGAGDVFILRR